MPIIKLKNVELYYEEFGAGDRYVIQAQQFINSHLNYVKDLSEKEGFHGYIIRIRGYAPSTLVQEDLGDAWYDVWAQDVCDFADAMGIKQFFYTGHSHGAGIGWHLCLNHPERLRGFFASAAGPHKKDGQATGGARMDTIIAARSLETWEPYAKKQGEYCAKYFTSVEQDPELGEAAKAAKEQMLAFWREMPEQSAILNPRKPLPKCRTEEELIEELRKVHTPLLMLGGSEDTISSPELMIRTLRAIEDSKLIIYQGADHVDLPNKFREEYVKDILCFCQERNLL